MQLGLKYVCIMQHMLFAEVEYKYFFGLAYGSA